MWTLMWACLLLETLDVLADVAQPDGIMAATRTVRAIRDRAWRIEVSSSRN